MSLFTVTSATGKIISRTDYLNARDVARYLSADTSGRYYVVPPAGSLLSIESFANGMSEG